MRLATGALNGAEVDLNPEANCLENPRETVWISHFKGKVGLMCWLEAPTEESRISLEKRGYASSHSSLPPPGNGLLPPRLFPNT